MITGETNGGKNRKYKRISNQKIDCEAIVLFGSYARGTQNAESDIDIAIKPNTNISKKHMYREYLELNESRQIIIDRIKKGDSIYGEQSSNNK